MMTELQRFPVLQKRMDEVVGNFLREGLEPSQAMIRDLIEMEVCMKNLISTLIMDFMASHIKFLRYLYCL